MAACPWLSTSGSMVSSVDAAHGCLHHLFELTQPWFTFTANRQCGEDCDPLSYTLEGRKHLVEEPFEAPSVQSQPLGSQSLEGGGLVDHHLVPSDGAAGQVADFDGDFMILGAPQDESAYIFERVDGAWEEVAHLQPSSGSFGDAFGCSVAISGNTAVVGTCAVDESWGYFGQGEAYIFSRSTNSSTWIEEEKLAYTSPLRPMVTLCAEKLVDSHRYEVCIGDGGNASQTFIGSSPNVGDSLGEYAGTTGIGSTGWGTGLVSVSWTGGEDEGCGDLKRQVCMPELDFLRFQPLTVILFLGDCKHNLRQNYRNHSCHRTIHVLILPRDEGTPCLPHWHSYCSSC